MTVKTLNIGSNRGKARLWIEGSFLRDAGFAHGDRYDVTVLPGRGLSIVHNPNGKRKIAGKPGREIIDITGKVLNQAGFNVGSRATLFAITEERTINVATESEIYYSGNRDVGL